MEFEMNIITIGEIVGLAGYMALEYWLGKTDKTASGSVLEFVVTAARMLLPSFKKKEKK